MYLRNKRGQFRTKTNMFAWLVLIVILALMSAVLVDMKQRSSYKVAEVISKVVLDCTAPEHMFVNDECAKRFTDPVAETWTQVQIADQFRESEYDKAESLIEEARRLMSEADENYDEKMVEHNLSVCQLELYRNKMIGDPCTATTTDMAGTTPNRS